MLKLAASMFSFVHIRRNGEVVILDRVHAVEPTDEDLATLRALDSQRSYCRRFARCICLCSPCVMSVHGRLRFLLWLFLNAASFVFLGLAFASVENYTSQTCPPLLPPSTGQACFLLDTVGHQIGAVTLNPALVNCNSTFGELKRIGCVVQQPVSVGSIITALAVCASLIRLILAGTLNVIVEWLNAKFPPGSIGALRFRRIPLLVFLGVLFSVAVVILLLQMNVITNFASFMVLMALLCNVPMVVAELLSVNMLTRPTPAERAELTELDLGLAALHRDADVAGYQAPLLLTEMPSGSGSRARPSAVRDQSPEP
jgi:hypothetical protein